MSLWRPKRRHVAITCFAERGGIGQNTRACTDPLKTFACLPARRFVRVAAASTRSVRPAHPGIAQHALTNQRIGVEETDDGVWSIYFHSVLLATLDERDCIMQREPTCTASCRTDGSIRFPALQPGCRRAHDAK